MSKTIIGECDWCKETHLLYKILVKFRGKDEKKPFQVCWGCREELIDGR